MTTVILAGLIAAIGTIVFVSLDDGVEATAPDPIATPFAAGDDSPQQPIILPEGGTQLAPLTPSFENTPLPTQIFDPTPTPPQTVTHVVRPGDTLYNIALAYNVTMEEIIEFSSLANPDQLEVGQELTIPLP